MTLGGVRSVRGWTSDARWLLLVAFGFALDVAITWEHWNNPIVDTGREMNQPMRLAAGETLYSDVRHIYGPLSPHLNALLFRAFGPSLGVLYADGMVSAALMVILVYDVSRRFVAPAAAAATAWMALWTCVVSAGGSFILPYSYNAVHGCVLGLATLSLVLRFLDAESERRPGASLWIAAAGACAGLAILAKTEMGLVALASGLSSVALVRGGDVPRALGLAAGFVAAALALVLPTYASIAAEVGWRTLTQDSFLLLVSDLPPELVFFNMRISGLDDPAGNLVGALLALVRLAIVGGVVSALGGLLPRLLSTDPGSARGPRRWTAAFLAVGILLGFRLARTARVFHGLRWSDGVFRAFPAALLAIVAASLWRALSARTRPSDRAGAIAVAVLAFYAVASLGRVALRVVLEQAETATLLPAAIAVLGVAATRILPSIAAAPAVRDGVRRVAVASLFAHGAWAAVVLFGICHRLHWVRIDAERGSLYMLAEYAPAFAGAIDFVRSETRPGDFVACLPEGTAIDFLTARRNPLREELLTPGYLDAEGERRTIERLESTRPPLVLIANRPMAEFGRVLFGRDYLQRLGRWIEARYEPVATFGRGAGSDVRFGDAAFFIRAYRPRAG